MVQPRRLRLPVLQRRVVPGIGERASSLSPARRPPTSTPCSPSPAASRGGSPTRMASVSKASRVQAHRADGTGDDWFGAEGDFVLTDAEGNYEIAGGLPEGDYRVEFRDDSGTYVTQWFDNKSDFDSADDVAVTAGGTTAGIDAVLVTEDAFNAITVTAPDGHHQPGPGQRPGGRRGRTNAAVATGEFSLWVVSPANGWYVGKIVAADGTASYADSVALNVPVDVGYRVYVYYRASAAEPWSIYGLAPGTVDVTAASARSPSAPPPARPARPRAAALPVAWTHQRRRSPPVSSASGWSAPANGWYVGKIVAADGTASYADSVDPQRARRRRLPRLRLLPRLRRRALVDLRPRAGHGRRDRGFEQHHRQRPRGHDQPGPGQQPWRSSWTHQRRRRQPASSASGWSPRPTAGTSARSSPPTAPRATPTASPSTCPSTSATASTSTTAPPPPSPGRSTDSRRARST